ncbi:uncharacterized protein LOC122849111 [Aphidius gifuensis]|uniref:uncharacterized protein LOC122849111 n=1 Tax=Aphidius gifuensis TaxID=684658 RepID=UPI001CDB8D20|nr:uncharacterized protein LOC122849111 [Aphidius gifuensis]
MRQRFWVLDVRNQVRQVIRKCMTCFRFIAEAEKFKMADLPEDRVNARNVFKNVGIDYCGPFFIKEKKFRNTTKIKIYVCVFVCMSVKAVHLEVVSDLTTEGFLGALRRFIARRGTPVKIYSDNGTNFVGAKNQLKELYNLLNSDEHKHLVHNFTASHIPRISWNFIPPLSPHQGGLWESTVKLFKHHLKRVVGESLFTYEVFTTFTTEVGGILNSRPLTQMSSDPNDLNVLTPAHILIGEPIRNLPEQDYTDTPTNRLSFWEHITKMKQHFWARWHIEYLHELQKRHKWAKDTANIKVGEIVLLVEKNAPCTSWPLGRVIEVYPGADQVVRTAVVKTANGTYTRSVTLLCPLPFNDVTPVPNQ